MVGRDREARAAPTGLRAARSTTARARCSRSSAHPVSASPVWSRSSSASVGCSTVLRGRCLPYGEGITYFPVVEMVKEAAGLADFDAPEVVETKICSVLGGRREPSARLPARRPADGRVGGREPPRKPSGRSGGCSRRSARERPLVLRLRRHPLGRGDVPGSGRARRGLVPGRSDPPGVHGSTRAARYPPVVERRQVERVDRSRWNRCRTAECDALIGNLLGSEELSGAVRDRIVVRGGREPAVRRGDAFGARRRRAARPGGRSVDAGGRPRRRRRPADDHGTARRTSGPARAGGARRARRRRRSWGRSSSSGAVRELAPRGTRGRVSRPS